VLSVDGGVPCERREAPGVLLPVFYIFLLAGDVARYFRAGFPGWTFLILVDFPFLRVPLYAGRVYGDGGAEHPS